jgi:hypothetical protein
MPNNTSPLPGTASTYNVNLGQDARANVAFQTVTNEDEETGLPESEPENVLGSVHISKPSIQHVFFLLRPLLKPLLARMEKLDERLTALVNDLALSRVFDDHPVALSQSVGYTLNYRNRRFLSLFTLVPLNLSINGSMTPIPCPPNVWTPITFPRGTTITAAGVQDSTPVMAIIRAHDEPLANNLTTILGPGERGWIAATGTGTAAQDNPLTFPLTVRKAQLYNASANPIPLEFDQISTATSFPILPGDRWIEDNIYCSAVHVFPSVTLPINTTAGLYIKGWQ